MKLNRTIAAALVTSCLVSSMAASVHGFPKLPKVPKVEMPKLPKVPELPQVPDAVKSVLPDGVAIPATTGLPTSDQPAGSGDLTDQYMADAMVVAQGTSIAGNSAANDERLDKEIAVYRAAVDRLASGRYDSVPAQMRASLDTQMSRYFDQRTQRVDADIAFIKGKVAENAGYDDRIGTRVYNGLISLESEMYAANILFPGRAGFADAKAKVDAMVEQFGSRGDEANNALNEIGAEQAAKVQMPPATNSDPKLVAMFRSALASTGWGEEPLKINPRGGWGVKRNSLGRVIGQTHDAAIAVRNKKIPGTCNLYNFTIIKETNGSVRRLSHSTQRIACENIK